MFPIIIGDITSPIISIYKMSVFGCTHPNYVVIGMHIFFIDTLECFSSIRTHQNINPGNYYFILLNGAYKYFTKIIAIGTVEIDSFFMGFCPGFTGIRALIHLCPINGGFE